MSKFFWLEREISAAIQQRIGPEYVGMLGILQAIATTADGTKFLLKEDLLSSRGDIRLYRPSIAVISVLLSYLVMFLYKKKNFQSEKKIRIMPKITN